MNQNAESYHTITGLCLVTSSFHHGKGMRSVQQQICCQLILHSSGKQRSPKPQKWKEGHDCWGQGI